MPPSDTGRLRRNGRGDFEPSASPALGRLHVALLAIGLAFLLVPAFSGFIWFDESYTLALVGHSPQEIWGIGSYDVHPVLYYEALHALLPLLDALGGAAVSAARALGLNPSGSLGAAAGTGLAARVLGTRLFSIAGTWATALLGLTHVSRDCGRRTGIAFTLLVLFTPISVELSSQIRMYSWTMFACAACSIYGLRIAGHVRAGEAAGAATWVVFAASSLAAAYLHYFGAMTAFALNGLLVVAIVRMRSRADTRIWVVQAVAQVALYLPWISVAAGQASSVSQGFWITLDPLACTVPFGWPLAAAAAMWALAGRKLHGNAGRTAAWGIGAYAFVLGLSLIVSLAMGHPIVLERYLAIPLAPALLALSALAGMLLEGEGGVSREPANSAAPPLAPRRRPTRRYAIVAVAALALVVLGASRQVSIAASTYGQSAALDALDGLLASNPDAPVISNPINFSGVAAVARPDIELTYINPYGKRNSRAYRAFSPTMRIVSKRVAAWPADDEPFIYLTSSSMGGSAKTAATIARETGGTVRELIAIERPYERQRFYVALVQRGDAVALPANEKR